MAVGGSCWVVYVVYFVNLLFRSGGVWSSRYDRGGGGGGASWFLQV